MSICGRIGTRAKHLEKMLLTLGRETLSTIKQILYQSLAEKQIREEEVGLELNKLRHFHLILRVLLSLEPIMDIFGPNEHG